MTFVPLIQQVGGDCHAWRSPDGSFTHIFLKLDRHSEPDALGGVVIIADANCRNATAAVVSNLRSELPSLLSQRESDSVVYWTLRQKAPEAEAILRQLSSSPEFLG